MKAVDPLKLLYGGSGKTDGCTALFVAAHQGHSAAVTVLLRAGAEVDRVGIGDSPALFVAAQQSHAAVVTTLMRAGADKLKGIYSGSSPLMEACSLATWGLGGMVMGTFMLAALKMWISVEVGCRGGWGGRLSTCHRCRHTTTGVVLLLLQEDHADWCGRVDSAHRENAWT